MQFDAIEDNTIQRHGDDMMSQKASVLRSYQSTKAAADVARVITTEKTTTPSWQLRCFLLCSGIFFL